MPAELMCQYKLFGTFLVGSRPWVIPVLTEMIQVSLLVANGLARRQDPDNIRRTQTKFRVRRHRNDFHLKLP